MTFVSGTGTVIEKSVSAKILNAEVYDAEVHGAMAAFEEIITWKRDRARSAIYVPLENSGAVLALLTGLTTSSSWRVQKFWKMTARGAAPVKVRWISGDSGLSGN